MKTKAKPEAGELTCSYCGKNDNPKYFESDKEISSVMRVNHACFTCAYWLAAALKKDDPCSVRVKGVQYWVGDEKSICERGFGGSYHKIRFADGRVVETTNLWYNGEVPSFMKGALQDNAEFVS